MAVLMLRRRSLYPAELLGLMHRRAGPTPPHSGTFGRFSPCWPHLASARLRSPRRKSLQNCSLWGQAVFAEQIFFQAMKRPKQILVGFAKHLKKHGRKSDRKNRCAADSTMLGCSAILPQRAAPVNRRNVSTMEWLTWRKPVIIIEPSY